MYTCYHCGADTVVWDSDFTFEDYNYEGDGLVCVCIIVTIVTHILNIKYQ